MLKSYFLLAGLVLVLCSCSSDDPADIAAGEYIGTYYLSAK